MYQLQSGLKMLQPQVRKVVHFYIKYCSQDSGSIMIFVIILAVIGSLMIGSVSLGSRYTVKKSGHKREKVGALFIAEAGKERVIGELRSKIFNPLGGTDTIIYPNEPFGDGTYTVSCSTNVTNDTIRILSTGTTGTNTVKLEVIAVMGESGGSGWIKGMVTARTEVGTVGRIEIDGNDYDTTNLYGTERGIGGTVGIWSGGAVSVDAASSIGGNGSPLSGTMIPGVTALENQDTTGYPQTPEEVLGLPPGALNSIKNAGCPSEGFFGIVYNETPCDFRNGSGIYIVHNDSGTASLGNFHSHFKGLIIADEVKHFNANNSGVLGAVVMLGKTTGGNRFGNGRARLHYSSIMVNHALNSLLPSQTRRPVKVVSWREVD